MQTTIQLDPPERWIVTTAASQRERRRGEDREVRARGLPLLADVPMPVEHGRDADFVEHLSRVERVVEAHPDLARRLLPHAVREGHDVMVEHDELVAARPERVVLGERAEPVELRLADGSVLAVEAPLRARTGIEAHECGGVFGQDAIPRPARMEVETDRVRIRKRFFGWANFIFDTNSKEDMVSVRQKMTIANPMLLKLLSGLSGGRMSVEMKG